MLAGELPKRVGQNTLKLKAVDWRHPLIHFPIKDAFSDDSVFCPLPE
jgi:hypothetical protein